MTKGEYTATRRDVIMDTLSDLVTDFLYYDRKEDGALPMDAIEEAVAAGEVSVDEMVRAFRHHLEKDLR